MICLFANKSDYKRYIEWYAKTYPVWDKKQFENNHKEDDGENKDEVESGGRGGGETNKAYEDVVPR